MSHSIVKLRCFPAINLFLKKSTIDVYYEKDQNFMVNRVVLVDFPSTVLINFYGVIYTAISRVY